MFNNIFVYLDKVIGIVNPQKLIYFAIGFYLLSYYVINLLDGVAPRAKMNQQRGRRFRSAQERDEQKEKAKELIEEWKSLGVETDYKAIL